MKQTPRTTTGTTQRPRTTTGTTQTPRTTTGTTTGTTATDAQHTGGQHPESAGATRQHGTAARRSERQDVVVLGAGYAGLAAATQLAGHARVTVVDPATRFTERVRLHEQAVGGRDVTHPLTGRGGLLGRQVTHVAARAAALDPAARTITTDDGRTLGYDRLVYALGSRTGIAPGASGGTGRVHTTEHAAELHRRLAAGPGSVAVVGGGLTGIEMAAEIAERSEGHRVRLLSDGLVGAGLSAKGRAHVHAVLEARGVRIEEGHRVAHPDDVDADTVVWAAAMVPNAELAAQAGLTLHPSGRIAVDEALRSVSHPEVYVPGDAGAAHSATAGAMRMGCAAALPTGVSAARSIIAELRGGAPRPLRFSYRIQCISLGRTDGLVQFVRADDSPRERALTGWLAARTKEQVVRTTVRFLRLTIRAPYAARLVPGMG
ncbi:NAD(P)/FAD-dependent oxidoreductase [Streptomyces sp. TS71-3]|uniref:NAD(P)/FAD-dependent oxidoreductase n=1 Tax=Streptomyces sp. TS71-3 TaxID=2733862 RepID=UPI001B2B89C0|nr:FAD-dependent oxidoreductase [Streptomyces sp. TS71-3]GHJ34837.1 dehydrogenase [Streptomyces sp. TS71-3]